MKIHGCCLQCIMESGSPDLDFFTIPYFEDRIGYVKCSRGHTTQLLLQSQKFEVLMESGAIALLNDFSLEACATFYSALERCYEFAIRVFMINRGMAAEAFNLLFKQMSNQSERQLGAFLTLYLTETGEMFKHDNDLAKFRNKVIHKGWIPTCEEAFEFCSKIHAIILQITDMLRLNFSDAVQEVVWCDLVERENKLQPDIPYATSSGTTFFNLAFSENKTSFNEALEHLSKSTQFRKAEK